MAKRISAKAILIMLIILLPIVIASSCIVVKSHGHPDHRLQWWLSDLNWDENRTGLSGKGVKIAVLDTTCDAEHKDLQNAKIHNETVIKSGIENDASHGTGAVGIISAYPASEKGLLGMAPDVEIWVINVTDNGITTAEYLVSGIEIAIEHNVDIINIGVGVLENSTKLETAINKAAQRGIIVIATAGNYQRTDMLYPAKYKNVIAIGSKSRQGGNISPQEAEKKDVLYFPGQSIVTLDKNNGYQSKDETAFSTAMASGMTALIMEANPGITDKELFAYLNSLVNNSKIDVLKCINLEG